MLKKFLLASILVLALNSVASAAYVEHNFKLVNDTGKNITQVYISPTGENIWKMFHAGNILNGETAEIIWSGNVFPPRPILRYFDIGVNYDDFSRQIWHGFDLYNYDEITLHAEGQDVIFKP